MGQLNSLDIRRLTRKEVLFYITIGSTVAYFWWKKRKVTLIQAPPRTSSLTRNGEEYDHRVTVKFEEFNQIVKESKLQLENLEAQVVQLQQKNQELDNISNQKIIEMKRLRQELESAKDDYSELLKKFRQEEQAIRTIKESNENLTKSLLAREKELSIAQKEIYKLREELERARRSSELMVDRMLTDLRSPRENLAKNGENNQESDLSSEGEYDTEDDDDFWDIADPKKIYKDSYLFESGGACVGGIWLAKDSRTNEAVVIKKIMAEKDDRPGYVHAIAKQEISIIKHLQKHPNIIDFYEAFMLEKGKEYWLVMEYMDAKTLFDIVTNHSYLNSVFPTEPQIAWISVEILKGLSFMHKRHVLHKDIKSENILFNERMQVKLADFGNSTRVDDKTGRAEPQEAVGTSYWMAPEIIAEEEHDGKVDVWSFGVVLYEMLLGLPPYNDVKDSEEVKSLILKDEFPPPWKQADEWSEVLRSFYYKCIVKDPAKRATADELLSHKFCTENVAQPSKVKELMILLDHQEYSDEEDSQEDSDSV
jgi:hypothetical protein